jgi:Acetoacetate decarboxylase (ADC)
MNDTSRGTAFYEPREKSGMGRILEFAMDPSHRIAGDTVIIGWEADPAVVRKFVPEPLTVDNTGTVFLFTQNLWNYSDRVSEEFVSDERYHLTECYFKVPCSYQGKTYYYVALSWASVDWVTWLSRPFGYPHKLAKKVQMTSFHPSDPIYCGPAPGNRVCVSVENVGLVLRADVRLQEECGQESVPLPVTNGQWPPAVCHRYVWDAVEARPALDDLVFVPGDDIRTGPIWTGDASLRFYDAEGEDVSLFAPRRIIGGWFFRISFNHRTSRPGLVHDYLGRQRTDEG